MIIITRGRELSILLQETKLNGVPLLVFANKQDLGGLSASDIANQLGLNALRDRQ